MYFDTSTLLSTLALFVSTRTCPENQHHQIATSTNLHSSSKSPAFSRISTRKFRPSLTFLNSESVAQNPRNYDRIVPYAVKQEKYVSLLEWLRANGAIVNDALEVAKSTQGEQAGYGAFVNAPVKEGEILFSIPRDLCVTIEKATTSVDDDGTFGQGLQTIVDKAGPGGSTVAMAGYMAKEYILLYLEKRDERLGLTDENSENSKSRWGPYMELLPWKRGINNQEHVLFWSEAKIEDLLKGSMCYSEARSLREEVALSVTVLGPLLKRSVRMARGDLSTDPLQRLTSLLPWQQYQKNDSPDDLTEILDDKLIGDAIKGAFVTLLTRSFADDVDQEEETDEEDEDANDGYSEKLVPLLDLLQHSDEPNVRHKVVGDSVEVRARVDIEAGSEIWNQYRSEEEESMPYSRFFTRFGFVPGIDEPIENLLIDKSPIFYPKKVEV